MTALETKAREFMELLVRDEFVENAWLVALSEGEEIACRQILANISASTPEKDRKEIEAHALDERRHSQELLAMRLPAPYPDSRYHALERKLADLYGSFVGGFFGNPLLVAAETRHAAYVHGAMTIEKAPFQLYAAYWKVSRLSEVRARLPKVL